MTAARRSVSLVLVTALAACGTSSSVQPVDLGAAAKRLTSARFTITIQANIAGIAAETQENGTISFIARQAHVYKLTGGSGQPTPVELIYDGETVYSNANVLAALANPAVKPWIRQRRTAAHVDDVDHVRALAALAGAAVDAQRIGPDHYRARVDPGRLGPAVARVVRADYVFGHSKLVYLLMYLVLFAGRAGQGLGLDGMIGRRVAGPPARKQ